MRENRAENQRGNKAYENEIRISIVTWKDIGTKPKSKMDVFKKDIENKSQTEKKIIWGRKISDTRKLMIILKKL